MHSQGSAVGAIDPAEEQADALSRNLPHQLGKHVMNIYVSNLDCNMSREQLREAFAVHRAVNSGSIVPDRCNSQYRSVGLVEMTDDQECQNAVQHLNGQMLAGHRIAAVDWQSKRIHSRGVNVEDRWWKHLV